VANAIADHKVSKAQRHAMVLVIDRMMITQLPQEQMVRIYTNKGSEGNRSASPCNPQMGIRGFTIAVAAYFAGSHCKVLLSRKTGVLFRECLLLLVAVRRLEAR